MVFFHQYSCEQVITRFGVSHRILSRKIILYSYSFKKMSTKDEANVKGFFQMQTKERKNTSV